jgi:hypothetical protein
MIDRIKKLKQEIDNIKLEQAKIENIIDKEESQGKYNEYYYTKLNDLESKLIDKKYELMDAELYMDTEAKMEYEDKYDWMLEYEDKYDRE